MTWTTRLMGAPEVWPAPPSAAKGSSRSSRRPAPRLAKSLVSFGLQSIRIADAPFRIGKRSPSMQLSWQP